MRADADEAVRRFAAETFVTPAPALVQGIARVLCGDLDGGDASLQDDLSAAPTCRSLLLRSADSAGRMWIVLLALLLRFRPCLRGFGLVGA